MRQPSSLFSLYIVHWTMDIYTTTLHTASPFAQPNVHATITDLLCNLPGVSPKKDVLLTNIREKLGHADIALSELLADICGHAYPLPDNAHTFSLVLSFSVGSEGLHGFLAEYKCHETLSLHNLHTHIATNISLNHPDLFPSREKSPIYAHLLRAQFYHVQHPYISWNIFSQRMTPFAFKSQPFSHLLVHNAIPNKETLAFIHSQIRWESLFHNLNTINERKHDECTFNHVFNLLSWLTMPQFALFAEYVSGISPLLPTYVGGITQNKNLSLSIQNQENEQPQIERKRRLRAIFFSEHTKNSPYPVLGSEIESNCILLHAINDERACQKWKGCNAVFVDFTTYPEHTTERAHVAIGTKVAEVDPETAGRIFISS